MTGEPIRAGLFGDGFELVNSRRTVHVAGNGKDFLLFVVDQPVGEFAGSGCFAGALQTGKQNHCRRLHTEIEAALFRGQVAADDSGEFALHHTDERLTGVEIPDHFLAHRFFLDAAEDLFHYGKCNVGFQKRKAHFAQHLLGVGFREARLAAHGLDDFRETLAEIVEHEL